MQAKVLLTIVAGVCLAFQVRLVAADQAADEAAIRANAAKYVEAYNRRDAKTMASMWSPDAVYISRATGEEVVGRDAIAKEIDTALAGAEDGKLSIHIDSIDFVSPNVAIEKGTSEVTYSKAQ
ncbi:MAG TPA: nuclear transport factor 2 family protein, partial [Lacipirellulaceae bacterium]|nr:nuclear transport factor 2 family protein [Lacipirellulaceae bacterium]